MGRFGFDGKYQKVYGKLSVYRKLVNPRCKHSSAKSLVSKVKSAFAGLTFAPALA